MLIGTFKWYKIPFPIALWVHRRYKAEERGSEGAVGTLSPLMSISSANGYFVSSEQNRCRDYLPSTLILLQGKHYPSSPLVKYFPIRLRGSWHGWKRNRGEYPGRCPNTSLEQPTSQKVSFNHNPKSCITITEEKSIFNAFFKSLTLA